MSYTVPASGNVPPTPGTVVIGDNNRGATVSGWWPAVSQNVQPDERLRGKKARFHARGNRKHEHVIKVDRSHSTIRRAQQFVRDHPLDVLRGGRLHIRIASRETIYEDAVVESCVALPEGVGVNTVHQYRIVTSDPITPNT